MKNRFVVIMAGGIGSRFWPFSRESFPKQFHDVLGTGKTLIQQTVERFDGICPKENIFIVTNAIYKSLVKEQLPFLQDDQILCEPSAKNTAPCIAYAIYKIHKKNKNANVIVSPSDHIILKENAFKEAVLLGFDNTENTDILVTLGINPTRPDTGYGYIQYVEDEKKRKIKKVKTFTEKPELDLAVKFIESGDFVWNAGIFIWNTTSVIKALKAYLPDIAELFQEGNDTYWTEKEEEFIQDTYTKCVNISIDKGIMEKAENVYVVLCDLGWSDLGTWKSLYDVSVKDTNENVIDGNVHVYDVKNSIIKTPKDKLVVVEGLENIIVAEYDGVLMICQKDHEQRVKDFVAEAKKIKGGKFF